MIKIDSSNLTTSNCWVINSQNQITSYQSNTRTRYYLFGNKWFRSDESSSYGVPSGYDCYTTQEIKDLPSPYDYLDPIYQFFIVFSVIAITYFAYKLIIYPFWRRNV